MCPLRGHTKHPEVVEKKSRIGDREIDTVVGSRHRGAPVSVVDRAPKFTFIVPVVRKTADAVGAAPVE